MNNLNCRKASYMRGFTLIELLVVVAILGTLTALLLPAVQSARESSRRTHCANNLKNMGLALQQYTAVFQAFPAGSDSYAGPGGKPTVHAWSTRILPYLEQEALFAQIRMTEPWNAEGENARAAETHLPIYVCPSSEKRFPGKQDYGGIAGTALVALPFGGGPWDSMGCGTLIYTSAKQPQPVSVGDVLDGLSHTLAVGESADRNSEHSGRWASGLNCLFPSVMGVVDSELGELFSRHPHGIGCLMADGHVHYKASSAPSASWGAMCTRNQGD